MKVILTSSYDTSQGILDKNENRRLYPTELLKRILSGNLIIINSFDDNTIVAYPWEITELQKKEL